MTTTTAPHWSDALDRLRACRGAVEWARQYDTLEEAWRACDRGDRMLWLAGRLSGPPESEGRKRLVLAACACARLVWELMPPESRNCVETAEAWARGEATIEQLRRAALAADAAYAAAADAAYAAYAANAAYGGARAACDAAYAAADAAACASLEHRRTLARCAEIVREHYPEPPAISA